MGQEPPATYTNFSESNIWQINRDFYQDKGIDAWTEAKVPLYLTSNAQVGKTYASLILAFLRDLKSKGRVKEKVYIIELGAGHGRLAFHIIKHLEKFIKALDQELPPFCYVLTDIVEENLTFFQNHPQFQYYIQKGNLDVAYFDATESTSLELRVDKKTIEANSLNQPIIALANYFFDSIPADVFYVKDDDITSCDVSLESSRPQGDNETEQLENLNLKYQYNPCTFEFYDKPILNDVLKTYLDLKTPSFIYFPITSILCLRRLKSLSKSGLFVISIDKGHHTFESLESQRAPDVVTHGSFSLWVNFHALGTYCLQQGGYNLFPTHATNYLQCIGFLMMDDHDTYLETKFSYQTMVNDFGPDDFNAIKRMSVENMNSLSLIELNSILRLGAYDSALFTQFIPRLKQLLLEVSMTDRSRFGQTLQATWDMYFDINEHSDLAFEIGGFFYDLAFYKQAISFFKKSISLYKPSEQSYYYKALSHYQLREDELMLSTIRRGKNLFPNNLKLKELDQLNLEA